ncbi:hypothetical protein KJ765_05630, partial [Candidatus Micrarchaeota archaeon]|nr:hypothetical protein [Candidatus Micrarchaeota archaeon]
MGNKRKTPSRFQPRSFNGATVFQPWETIVFILLVVIKRRLQWSHGFSTMGNYCIHPACCNQETASMEPRFFNHGKAERR